VEDSIDQILGLVPDTEGRLKALVFDATDLESVKTVAEQLCETERLHILVNNTDLGLRNLETNKTGISTQMLTNHLAPMLFTLTALPLLKKTALDLKWNVRLYDVRIVNVNSTLHSDAPATSIYQILADFNEAFPEDVNGEEYARYAHTKLANALFSFALQQRLHDARVPIIVTYPYLGTICTVSDDYYRPGNKQVLTDQVLSLRHGAMTSMFCAVSSRIKVEE
jgi:NAD(P)-dependent dehydrogenase (short-subunit alcohol dehydrogenase family)